MREVSFRFEWSTAATIVHCERGASPTGRNIARWWWANTTPSLQARRQEMQFKQKMKQRNVIEAMHSELERAHGLRRARHRGLKTSSGPSRATDHPCSAASARARARRMPSLD